MKMIKFEACVENRILNIRKVLLAKAKEYATEDNSFHNFDVAARIINKTPEQALQGMMLKHIVSVLDLVEWTETNTNMLTEKIIDEKIGDTINYLILLEGLLLRRMQTKNKTK
jgi:hypothetical protein